ncbi:MAG: aminotransferase class V-fold PLP-dependent enzyme [Nitrososphaerales archaeon]
MNSLEKLAYFNWAGISPALPEVRGAMAAAEFEFERRGWLSQEGLAFFGEQLWECRRAVGELLGVMDEKTIALTQNASEAINIVLQGLRKHLKLVVTTDQEHPSAEMSLKLLAQDSVSVKIIPFTDQETFIECLKKEVSSEPGLIFLSHISYKNGAELPIHEVAKLAHEKGWRVFADGAQAVGQLSVRVQDLGVDFYAFSGHKWLFGPMGTGALWVKRDLIPTIQLIQAGWRSKRPLDDASRFEVGTTNIALAAGLSEAARLADTSELTRRSRISRDMKSRIYQYLAGLREIKILSQNESPTGILSFQHPRGNHLELAKRAADEHRVIIKPITPPEFPESLRVSFSYLNTTSELDRLTKCLHDLFFDDF